MTHALASYAGALVAGSLLVLGAFSSCQGCRTTPTTKGRCVLVEQGYGPEGEMSIRVETVVEGLEVPWALAFLPGGDLLVTERPGRIRRIEGALGDGEEATLVPMPVATLPADDLGEGGLLGLALHPGFEENRLFFVYFTARTDAGTVNRVERWRLSPDGRSAERETGILDGIPAARFHDGGRLRIGPDGMLYVATGDAGTPSNAQDPDSLAGKLLRLTPDGAIPDDNPLPGSPVYLLGLRNSEGFDWTPDGRLRVVDHGPSGELGRTGHDEVNTARAGENLGWPTIYGCRDREGLVPPSLTWDAAVPPGGAAVYTGEAIPEWRGSLLFGTLGARHLHRAVFSEGAPRRIARHEVYLQDAHGRLRETIMGPDGELYVTTSNCDGRGSCPPGKDRILRITR